MEHEINVKGKPAKIVPIEINQTYFKTLDTPFSCTPSRFKWMAIGTYLI